jgi:hypothetical protein
MAHVPLALGLGMHPGWQLRGDASLLRECTAYRAILATLCLPAVVNLSEETHQRNLQ